MARAPSPADVVDRVQARPRRSQDDRRLRRPGAKPRAAAAAADPHRGRHPRGRAGHLERVEADRFCVPCSRPPRSGCGSATSSMAAPSWSQGGRRSSPPQLGWKASAIRAPCQAAARQLLARRAARLAGRQCAAGCRGRGAHRRGEAERRRRGRSGQRRDPGQRLHARPRRAVLPHLRGRSPRPAPTSSTRASTPRATAWRSTISSCWTVAARPYADRRLRSRLGRRSRRR